MVNLTYRISPEAVAARAERSADPREIELLMFISWYAGRPEGLPGFAEAVIEHAGASILPEEFHVLRADGAGRFSAGDALKVWNKLPEWARPSAPDNLRGIVERVAACEVDNESAAEESGLSKAELDAFRDWLTRECCMKACKEHAVERFRAYFATIFGDANRPVPNSLNLRRTWCGGLRKPKWPVLGNLSEVVLRFMQSRSSKVKAEIAPTTITEKVFEALDYAWGKKAVVHISGSARYGKTESLQTYCKAHPGRARLVHTVGGNGERELLLGIAEALGVPINRTAAVSTLKERITYVLHATRVMLVFDEAQFLLPTRVTSLTAPARLNFIRREIVDRGLPCVFAATPQAYNKAVRDFVTKTKYVMEHWLGRIDLSYPLPEEFTKEEVLEVARLRFAEVPEKVLRLIVARAQQSEHFLHALQAIGKRAEWIAEKRGGRSPSLEDVQRASDEFAGGAGLDVKAIEGGTKSSKLDGTAGLRRSESASVPLAPSRLDLALVVAK